MLFRSVKPNNTAILGSDGRQVPAEWKVRAMSDGIRVDLPGTGTVELVDANGKWMGSASGTKVLRMAKPVKAGVYYAVIRSEGQRAVLPVLAN